MLVVVLDSLLSRNMLIFSHFNVNVVDCVVFQFNLMFVSWALTASTYLNVHFPL